jgi:Cof subfamily protein (haloacid dehalogenase superfamily)
VKKIVFFDLDGTILNEEKKILESTKKAVRILQNKGIYTVLATGRVPQMFDWILEELNINSYVCINGQYVVFEGKEIYSNPIDPVMLHDITSVASCKGDAVAFCNNQHVKVSEENHSFISTSFSGLKMDYPAVDPEFYRKAPIYQGHLYCDRQDVQMYVERYPEYSFIQWDKYASDFIPKGSSKAIGIQKLLEVANIDTKNSYAFGDGLNDLEMLSLVGTGIAMGNAVPAAKDIATFVTASCSEDGIFKGLLDVGLLEDNKSKSELIS